LLLERGIVVTYETIRCWCNKFDAAFAQRTKAARRKPGSTWHLDELFVTLRGEPYLLWRAVDEYGSSSTFCCRSDATSVQRNAFFEECCARTHEQPGLE
jgi:putative transposase